MCHIQVCVQYVLNMLAFLCGYKLFEYFLNFLNQVLLSFFNSHSLPVKLFLVLSFLQQVSDAVQNVHLSVRCSTKPLPQKGEEEFYQ